MCDTEQCIDAIVNVFVFVVQTRRDVFHVVHCLFDANILIARAFAALSHLFLRRATKLRGHFIHLFEWSLSSIWTTTTTTTTTTTEWRSEKRETTYRSRSVWPFWLMAASLSRCSSWRECNVSRCCSRRARKLFCFVRKICRSTTCFPRRTRTFVHRRERDD